MKNLDVDVIPVEETSMPQLEIRKVEVQKRKSATNKGIALSKETIQPYLKGTLRDAAKHLGVSPSKLKCVCREDLGIENWQQERNKAGYPKRKRSCRREFVEATPYQQTSCTNDSTVAHNCKHKPSPSGQEIRETLIVKAQHNEDIIRFRLPVTASFSHLKEEVAQRLDLELDAFTIKYMDDDHEWVLLTCQPDLDECIFLYRSLGTFRLSISDIPGKLTKDRCL